MQDQRDEFHPYTLFASPERATAEEIARQHAAFAGASPLVVDMLDRIPDIVLILNQHRQIVFANKALLEYLNCASQDVLGLRPGEALDCVHAADEEWGCGTSEFCRMCGAARAVLQGLSGKTAVQECRITRTPRLGAYARESLDLRVHAAPLQVEGQPWVQFVLTDISHEKRRRSLETIFFHDVLNTATAVRAAADLIARRSSDGLDGLPQHLQGLSHRLIDEITAQRLLTEAESDELQLKSEHVNASRLLLELAESTSGAEGTHGRKLRIDLPEIAPELTTDATLLRRVLANMLKNAVEATPAGGAITVGCADRGDHIEFWMNNPGEIPRNVQLQIFQRSFTTKGAGRGLGAYSMRLLTERYLGGRVDFTSSPTEGVTFRATYPKRR
ncbi:MAG: ATP-binding protein [Anaerolineae bacterium]|jgi:signal transduction histidine kinase|nr:ATP-binding protein [Anaerolineae bacterium]